MWLFVYTAQDELRMIKSVQLPSSPSQVTSDLKHTTSARTWGIIPISESKKKTKPGKWKMYISISKLITNVRALNSISRADDDPVGWHL